MDIRQLLTEFSHRKSDGIGMSERYPHLADALRVVYDLLPRGVTDISSEDAARLLGRAAEKGPKASESLARIITEGPVLLVAENVVDAALTAQTGSEIPALVRQELIAPMSTVSDKIKDMGSTLIGICVTLGAYNLIQAGQDYLHGKDAAWHARTGTAMQAGSDLEKSRGDHRHVIVPDARSQPVSSYIKAGGNPFAAALAAQDAYADMPRPPTVNGRQITAEMQARLATHNPFVKAPHVPHDLSAAQLSKMARFNRFMTDVDPLAHIDPHIRDGMSARNPLMRRSAETSQDRDSPWNDLRDGPRQK